MIIKSYLIVLALLFCSTTSYAQYIVDRVVDGDTIKLTNGERVRLIGIDTPESKANAKAKKDAERSAHDVKTITDMGKEATKFVKGILPTGAEVRLEYDVRKLDKYGRTLAYVYELVCKRDCAIEAKQGYEYVKLDDGWYVFINATIVKSGYASPMTIPPDVKYTELFKKLFDEAREHKRGLWNED